MACVSNAKNLKPDDKVKQYSIGPQPLVGTEWRNCRACVQLAGAMEAILDEFQVSFDEFRSAEALT